MITCIIMIVFAVILNKVYYVRKEMKKDKMLKELIKIEKIKRIMN